MTDLLTQLHHEIVACRRCQRLVDHREAVAREKRAAYRDQHYWGKPLTGFGDRRAELLIVGLAPAAHGGNRTGRIFTGDSSGTFLMRALHQAGFASLPDSVGRDDGLELINAFMTAVVRCAPPDNKPLPEEVLNCRHFLMREASLLPEVRAVLALGKIAMDGYLNALISSGLPVKRLAFRHGAEYELPGRLPRLFVSYHPSRQNTQTGRLTPEMLDEVLGRIGVFLRQPA